MLGFMTETTTNDAFDSVTRALALAAALLFALALLTGLYAGAAMGGKLHVSGAAALASHLNALMGTFLIVSFGWTLPMLRYGERGKTRLASLFIATSYANWLVTAVKAALGVRGVDVIGNFPNDAVFVILQITVVAPTIVGALFWVFGFRKGAVCDQLDTLTARS